jgi:hypothetical protein
VGLFPHQNELNMNQKMPCLQMLSWKLHVRMSMSPQKSPFIVFITPGILNKNGGDRLRKMLISKNVDFFNYRRRNTRKLQVFGSANKRIWTLHN